MQLPLASDVGPFLVPRCRATEGVLLNGLLKEDRGNSSDIKMEWPNNFSKFYQSELCRGVEIKKISRDEKCPSHSGPKRIASIFRKSLDDSHGSKQYDWLGNPCEIEQTVMNNSNFGIFGLYDHSYAHRNDMECIAPGWCDGCRAYS